MIDHGADATIADRSGVLAAELASEKVSMSSVFSLAQSDKGHDVIADYVTKHAKPPRRKRMKYAKSSTTRPVARACTFRFADGVCACIYFCFNVIQCLLQSDEVLQGTHSQNHGAQRTVFRPLQQLNMRSWLLSRSHVAPTQRQTQAVRSGRSAKNSIKLYPR